MKRTLIFAGVLFVAIVLVGLIPSTTSYEQPPRNSWPYIETHPVPSIEPIEYDLPEPLPLPEIKATSTPETAPGEVILAQTTAYNTLPGQTDDTPCISASGDNICGRTDVVACPTYLPLGTMVEIHGATYVCLDRTNQRFAHRFDISFDKDLAGALQYGVQTVEVKIIDA